MLQSYKGRIHLISKPRPRQTPMIRNRFRADMFTNILNLFQVMNSTGRLVLLTSNRIIATRMLIFRIGQTLSIFLLALRDLHDLFKNIHVGAMSSRVILNHLLRLPTHLSLATPWFISNLQRQPRRGSFHLKVKLLNRSLLPYLSNFRVFKFSTFGNLIIVLTRIQVPSRRLMSTLNKQQTLIRPSILKLSLVPITIFNLTNRVQLRVSSATTTGRQVTTLRLDTRP